MFKSFTIRDLTIDPPLALAPMSGVTNVAFRLLIRALNDKAVGLVVSEFISIEGLTRDSLRSHQMLRRHKSERPLSIQIFGADVGRMADAAKIVEQSGADIVDINCGCPAPKVVKKGGGCELMRKPVELAKILSAARAAIKIPLTLKIRSGWDQDSLNAVEVAKIAEECGVEAIAVHGRTRAQLYRGLADWSVVAAVVDAVKIPVLGSGDVVCRDSAAERLAVSGASGVMIGRAALANPWVFSEILDGVKRFNSPNQRSLALLEMLSRYVDILLEYFAEHVIVGKLKQIVSQACKKERWKTELLRASSFKEQCETMSRLKEIFLEDDFLGKSISSTKASPLIGNVNQSF
ncbi:MAG TPA: tRNA dihydrouridine synthase DusB [Oligoflexia bacterium]|nr:tRNA dihydrouridine synthase DusB [Oligoflexia bacterium]HMP27855.1 tRNA dihydrouridine synthase DusB [Oligoflexia bacterium]